MSRAALLAAGGRPATATAVAGLYRDLCHRFVLDAADDGEADAIGALGVAVTTVPTLLHRGASADRLVEAVLGAEMLRPAPAPVGRG